MKNIKILFQREAQLNPYASDYINFANAVKGQKFTRDAISKNFKILVSKEEYSISDKFKLITNLHSLSKRLEDSQIGIKKPLSEARNHKDDTDTTNSENLLRKVKNRVSNNYQKFNKPTINKN